MGKIIQNYSLQHQLGSGVYSKVYKAINLKTKQDVAIKMVKAEKFKQLPKLQEGTVNQINILTNLQYCPHIIRYYDMLKTVNNFYFVYEYCNGGTLQGLLKKEGPLQQKVALQYFSQIVEAFKVLNKNNIMHRDLKPDNILIHEGILKLADFGFCKPLQNEEDTTGTMLGSPIYMAPEILRGETYTIKADIWSLGVVLFRMLYGYCPFESSNIGQLIMKIDQQDMKIPPQPAISPRLANLLRKMLTKNPSLRADWSEIFSHQIKNGEIVNSGIMKLSKNMTDSGNKSSLTPTMESSTGGSKVDFTSFSHREIPKIGTFGERGQHRREMRQQSKQQVRNELRPEMPYNPARDPHLRATYTTKSPIRENIRKDLMLKNHSKCIDMTTMITFLIRYDCFDSLVLAYLFSLNVQKELNGIMDSIKKQGNMIQSDVFLKGIWQAVEEELCEIRKNLQMLEQEINSLHDGPLSAIQPHRRIFLKRFINSLRFEHLHELIMASRVVDLMEDSLLIRKQTYERMSRDQLMKKIRDKMQTIVE